jgi:integrase/recombinase XerD
LICFYQTGVDLTEEEFNEYHTRKDLKKQFDDIIYYLNKADKIVKDWVVIFHGKNLIRFITIVNQQVIKLIINRINKYCYPFRRLCPKLYGEGSIKTSKGYTTTANHLKDYLKKKDDCLLFSDITPEFLNLLEKYFLSSKMKLSYSSIGVYMRNIRTIFNLAISKKIISSELYPFGKGKYVPPHQRRQKKRCQLKL